MAAIGKMRSWGPVLIIILGLALFGFIAESAFETFRGRAAVDSNTAGIIDGEKVDIQEFQNLVGEYQELLKLQGRDNLDEEQLNSLRDYVWETYVQNKIIEKEAKALGITVTPEEVVKVLKEGTNPAIAQTPLLQEFVNPQTQTFDANQVNAYREYMKQQAQINQQAAEQYVLFERCWPRVEKMLAEKLLEVKYQTLLAGCVLSNPVSAQASFNNQNVESKVLLASVPYNTINDNDVEVSESDLKAKYNEMKERFKTYQETRDIKFVVAQVMPSQKDRDDLMTIMEKASSDFRADSIAVSEVIRNAQSKVAYLGLPLSRTALPADLADTIVKMNPGQVTAPFESRDNSLNVVKFIAKTNVPDSVEFRLISLMGMQNATASADSILKAVNAGAPFDTIAKKYNQRGEKAWFTSGEYESASTLSADNKLYYSSLMNMGVGEVKNLQLSQGNVILQVTDRKGSVEKYDVAVVKRTIDFSNDTYNEAYNKFSQFVSESQNVAGLTEKAAEFGYVVMDRTVANTDHIVAGIRSTHDALKWLFTEAEEGHISQVYDRCGDNDRLLVVGLDKVNPEGYASLASVQEGLKQEVLRDKKFAKVAEKLQGAKSIAEAQANGARVDTVSLITFSSPVFIPSVGMPEPSLSGAVAGVEKGGFSKNPVKGMAGAYVFQVIDRATREGVQFNAAQIQETLRQQALQQTIGMAMQELRNNIEIKDNRYIFF